MYIRKIPIILTSSNLGIEGATHPFHIYGQCSLVGTYILHGHSLGYYTLHHSDTLSCYKWYLWKQNENASCHKSTGMVTKLCIPSVSFTGFSHLRSCFSMVNTILLKYEHRKRQTLRGLRVTLVTKTQVLNWDAVHILKTPASAMLGELIFSGTCLNLCLLQACKWKTGPSITGEGVLLFWKAL